MSTHAWHTVCRPEDVWEQEQVAVMHFSDVCSSSQPESIDSSKGSAKEPCRERRNPMQTSFTKAINLYFYRDLMSNSLLFLEKSFPTPGYILGEAMLCPFPLAGLTQNVSSGFWRLFSDLGDLQFWIAGKQRQLWSLGTLTWWCPRWQPATESHKEFLWVQGCRVWLLRKELMMHVRSAPREGFMWVEQARVVMQSCWVYTVLNSSAFLQLLLALSGS